MLGCELVTLALGFAHRITHRFDRRFEFLCARLELLGFLALTRQFLVRIGADARELGVELIDLRLRRVEVTLE